jgi:multicomponent K+:H+ antiporter subunit E
MKRLLPAPLLSASLFVLWLVLNQSVSAGHLLLAAVLSVSAAAAHERDCAPAAARPPTGPAPALDPDRGNRRM